MTEDHIQRQEKSVSRLEALLFIHGEPITLGKLGEILEESEDGMRTLLAEFEEELKRPGRGLALLMDGDKVQLVTKKEWGNIVAHFITSELTEDLSPASLETLSLIAYLGPISRSIIEYHRGVNSSFTLRNLLLRGLVERFPDPKRRTAYLYEPSFEFLRHLGAERRESLPDYARLRKLLASPETLLEEGSHTEDATPA